MGAWILQVDPNSFGEGHPVWQRGEVDWWCLSRRLHVRKGDTVFLWQAIDYRCDPPRPRGIYARATITAVPPLTPEETADIDALKEFGLGNWANSKKRAELESRPVSLLLKYEESYAGQPLTKDEITEAGLDRQLHLVQFPNQEGCPITDFEARAILTLFSRR